MSLPVIVLGAGGHAKVLIDALRLAKAQIAGIVDADAGTRQLPTSAPATASWADARRRWRKPSWRCGITRN